MNKLEFQKQLKLIFNWVGEREFELFEKYKKIVQEYNQKFNLTRLDADEKIYEQFFLDSILPYSKINFFQNKELNKSLIDIGSGSGIPGVVLKIIFPEIKLSLLEANTKRCEFLSILTKFLGFNDVKILNIRAEDLTDQMREKYDIATSRAVASLYKILEVSTPFVKVNGLLIQPKSLKFYEEEEEAKGTISTLKLNRVSLYEISSTNHHHIVGVYQKNEKTPKTFPRTWAMISKKPL